MNGYMAGFGKTFASNAMYLAVGFLILAILFLMGRKRKAVFLPLALTFLMLMITGIKSLMFFPLIGVAAVYFLNHSDNPKKTAGKIVCTLLVLLIISAVLSLFIPQLRIVVIRVIRAYERGDVTNGRIHLYKTAFSLFLKHPLFGIGWYEFMYYYLDLFGALKYVHNVYLQLLTENGILLSLPFFALFFSGYVRTVRAVITLRRDMKPVCDPDMDLGLALSVGMQTFFLLYCMTGNALNNLQVFYPYMCCLSIGEFYMEKLKQKNAQLSGCANETIAVREINP
jgi:O-antigen ligase